MAWETRRGRGRYWTRSRKVNGRVVREYIGTGRVAELVAQMDAIEREQRGLAALDVRQAKDELAALDADLKALDELGDLVVRAALLAAGYRRHKRGEWRKKRGNRKCANRDGSNRPEGTSPDSGTGPGRR